MNGKRINKKKTLKNQETSERQRTKKKEEKSKI